MVLVSREGGVEEGQGRDVGTEYDEFSVHCDIQSIKLTKVQSFKLSYKFGAMSQKPRSKAEAND